MPELRLIKHLAFHMWDSVEPCGYFKREHPWSSVSLLNRAVFCPDCGQIWLRDYTYTEHGEPLVKRWIIEMRACPRHGHGSIVDWQGSYLPETADSSLLFHDFMCLSKGEKYAS